MIKFKDVKDLMSKIDEEERPTLDYVLFCNKDTLSYLSKLIPEFQINKDYQNVLSTGEGYVGWYQDNLVFIHPKIPNKTIHWDRYDYRDKLDKELL